MRTMNSLAKRMLTGILAAVAILGTLTSCFETDNPANYTPIVQKILGTWYASYDIEGTIDIDEDGVMVPREFNRVVETYQFLEGGEGVWNRYFFPVIL